MMCQSHEEMLSQIKQAKPLKVRFADEAGPSTAPSAIVTPSTPGTDTTILTTPSSNDFYTDPFNFALSKIFSSTLMASLTSKDALLKEVRLFATTGNEERCRQISPYIHSYSKDHQVKNGCVCGDDQIAFPNSIRDAYVEAIHAPHPRSSGMTDLKVHAWRPFMHRVILSKTAKCNPCVKIGRNLKSIISSSKWAPLKLCKVPYEDIEIDFGLPVFNGNNQKNVLLRVWIVSLNSQRQKYLTGQMHKIY